MKSGDSRFDREAESFRIAARARLARLGRPTTDRRIKSVIWWDQDDEPPEPFITVGEDHPDGPEGDPVLAILESARFEDMYYVCTLRDSGAREAPLAIALGKWWRVVEFDA
jgi:hypothetical protein